MDSWLLLSCIILLEGLVIGLLAWRLRRLRRERVDQQRTEAALFAAEREAVLGRMAGRVAHEVNNPLEAIKIYIEPLRHRVRDRPEVDHGLVVIDQQVDRIARLVRGLLDLVRQRALNRSSVHVDAVITTVVELMRPRFEKEHKRLELTLDGRPGSGALDVDGVQQVLINLLENALAATPSEGWVRVACRCHDDWLHLTICDNGCGLGADPEALFQPFVTTKADGTGLGLAVARRICKAHGGWLKGRNRDGGGAEFTLALRLEAART